jgi:EAL domain-containing protein (putative c-di-GMP-specific phosphodiesterase class I)
VVKIDKSFVQHEGGTDDAPELIRKIIETGQVLKLEVVAEGIEEQSQLEELRAMGCKVGQGYLFAKPMDAADVPGHLAEEFSEKSRVAV